jgi:hypothetical protein
MNWTLSHRGLNPKLRSQKPQLNHLKYGRTSNGRKLVKIMLQNSTRGIGRLVGELETKVSQMLHGISLHFEIKHKMADLPKGIQCIPSS